MNFLIVGDIQCKRENLHLVEKLFDTIEEIGLPVILLGDLLERRGLIEAECLNAYYKYFKASKLKFYVIVGNHEMLSIHSKETALLPLKSLSNVVLVDTPTFLGQNTGVLLVPYYRNPIEFLNSITFPGVKYLIGHQGVKEFTLGSGYTETEAVNIKDLKQFKQVICGHYHSPQERENVVYLGSPFSHSFSEANEVKRLGIFDEEQGLISYIETDFPKHLSFDVNCDEFAKGDTISAAGDNFYRVCLKGSADNISKFPKEQYPNVKFIEQPDSEQFESEIKETESHEAMFTKWLRDVKKEDDMDIEDIGLGILKEVK